MIASLSIQLKLSKHTLERKTHELITERQLNHQLLARLRELEREIARGSQPEVSRDSHNSSLPPSHDLPWQKIKRTQSLRQKSDRQVGGQVGHPGKTLLQVEHPDRIIIHTPVYCAACDASLASAIVVATERRQVFDIAAGTLFVTEHQAQTKQCQQCRTATKAKFPVVVRAPVQGFARVISDYATYAYLGDVYILESYRGRGLSKWLMECIMAHPDLQGLRRFSLVTRDAHGLYRKFGFTALQNPDGYMELLNQEVYQKP